MEQNGIIGLIIGLMGGVLLEVIRSILSRRRNSADTERIRAEADAIDAQTVNALRLQIKGLVEDNIKLHENLNLLTRRIDELKDENRKFRNAYARVIRHVEDLNPGVELPDYLLETQPLIKK